MTANKVARKFESTPLHHPVPQFSDVSDNRSKSARLRAICDRERTRRAAAAGAKWQNAAKPIRPPFCARSMEVRPNIALVEGHGDSMAKQKYTAREIVTVMCVGELFH